MSVVLSRSIINSRHCLGRGLSQTLLKPVIVEAHTPSNEVITVVADETGYPCLRFDTDRDYFIRFLPPNADLERLSKNDNWEIREAVALDARADKKLLRRLARDGQEEVREAAKSNPNFVPLKRSPRRYAHSADIDRNMKAMDTAWKKGDWDTVAKRWNQVLELASQLPTPHHEAVVLNACLDWLRMSVTSKMFMHAYMGRQLRTALNVAITGHSLSRTFGIADASYWEAVIRTANETGCKNRTLDALANLWTLTEYDADASRSGQRGSTVTA